MTRRRRIAMRILTGLVVYNFAAAAVIKLTGLGLPLRSFADSVIPNNFGSKSLLSS